MNWNVSLKELEAEATRAAIHIAMLEAIGAIVFFVVLYFVVKAADQLVAELHGQGVICNANQIGNALTDDV